MWYLDQYGTDPPVSLVVRAVKQVRTRVRTYVRYVRTTNVGKQLRTDKQFDLLSSMTVGMNQPRPS